MLQISVYHSISCKRSYRQRSLHRRVRVLVAEIHLPWISEKRRDFVWSGDRDGLNHEEGNAFPSRSLPLTSVLRCADFSLARDKFWGRCTAHYPPPPLSVEKMHINFFGPTNSQSNFHYPQARIFQKVTLPSICGIRDAFTDYGIPRRDYRGLIRT